MSQTLNQAQQEAVLTKDGPLLILAGAGAGKTKTITERIVHLIKSGAAPHNILAITFTNKAAKEMQDRIIRRLREEGIVNDFSTEFDRPLIKTFHSFGVYILRKHAQAVNLTKNFIIKDSGDSSSLIKQAMVECGLDPKEKDPGLFKNTISKYKSDFVTADELTSQSASHTTTLIAQVWRKYEELLQKENSVDFDDLLTKTVILFKTHPEILERYQKLFQYISVDEYQDTNQVQYELCMLLASAHKNICVVGDGDQNIYSWRGANIKNILQFEKDYPNAKVVLLEENYRSTGNILLAANEIIKKNTIRKDKNLFTNSSAGELLSIVQNYDERSEALFVAKRARALIEEGVGPDSIAVLYRANFQSRVIEEAMITLGVSYQVLGMKFFERKEIKDVISYIRAALARDSLTDLKRVFENPKRGIGRVTMLKIFSGELLSLPKKTIEKVAGVYSLLDTIETMLTTNTLREVLEYTIQKSGIEQSLLDGSDEDRERLENVRELVSLVTKYDHLLGAEAAELFLEESTLISDQDNVEKQSGVKLMTVHASKGLEFNTVFVVGLENELFPHIRIGATRQSKEDQEEERRLFYVAVTRAEKKLYLTYADVRTVYGNRQLQIPSPFLADIPHEICDFEIGEARGDSTSVVYL